MTDYLKSLNWLTILAIIVAVETQIGNGTMSLTNMFPDVWVPHIKPWAANLGTLGSLIVAEGSRGRVPATSLPSIQPLGKMILMIGAVLASLLLLSGGAAFAQPTKALTKSAAQSNPIAVLQAFAVTDLQNALSDAQGQTPPDQAAINCYQALIPIVQQANGIKGLLPKSAGLFQALQKARDAKAMLSNLQSPSGPLAAINLACAALAMDTQNTLVQLGILSGAVAAGGGLTLPIALPALAF